MACTPKAALTAVVGGGMWLGRPLGEAAVFAAVAAGGKEDGRLTHTHTPT